jgi:cell division inhibitor SepF
MGGLRKAGVWLGLVEDDEDRGYDERGYRSYNDDFGDEDDVDEAPVTPRARVADRTERVERSTDRAPVRSLSRTTSTVSYPTRDNLALAPQVQVRERPAAVEED